MKTYTLISILCLASSLTNAQSSWTQKTNFGGTARYGMAGFSVGSKGYIGTGIDANGSKKDFWEYDPATNAWSQKADFGGTARWYAIGFSIGAYGYLGTGNDDNGAVKDFWQYDPLTNSWTKKADVGGTGRALAIGFSIGDKGYVGTGYNGSSIKNDFWEYDPSSNSWTKKANAGGKSRYGGVGFSIAGKGYIGDGVGDIVSTLGFWEYDPSTDTWTKKAEIDGERHYSVGFSIGGKGYIGTGTSYGVAECARDFWEYDPSSNTWTEKDSLPGDGRELAVGFSIGNKEYICGGFIPNTNTYLDDSWEYAPDQGCSIPAGLATTNITSTNAQLNWNSVASATKYKVKYKRDSMDATWITEAVTAPTTSLVLSGLLHNSKYKWKVKSICGNGVTSDFSQVLKFTTLLRLGDELSPLTSLKVYPNPVVTSATVYFSLKDDSFTRIELLDLSGRTATTLVDGIYEAGDHTIQLNCQSLSAGIYFLRVQMDQKSEVVKLVVQ